jgi:glycosyltransferase involved in cell wall biosynthesis
MPVYNAGAFLDESMRSVLSQSFGDFEFVIVDDGSTDGSSTALDEWARRDSRIRVIHQPNSGMLAALNRGLTELRGGLVARMDADDISMPERFAKQVAFLDANPQCVAVGARTLNITPDGLPITEFFRWGGPAEIEARHLVGRCSIAHPSVMIRRAALDKVGPYRGSFAEDLDLWLRLGEVGMLANLPDVLLKYRLNSRSLSYSKNYRNDQILWDFVAEARQRRGLPALAQPTAPQSSNGTAPGRPSEAMILADWARAALHGGNYHTARVLSRRALGRSRGSTKIWATLLLAHLGPVGALVLRRRAEQLVEQGLLR